MKATALSLVMMSFAPYAAAEAYVKGETAADIIKNGDTIAVELRDRDWYLLVQHDDTLYACSTLIFADSNNVFCRPLPFGQD